MFVDLSWSHNVLVLMVAANPTASSPAAHHGPMGGQGAPWPTNCSLKWRGKANSTELRKEVDALRQTRPLAETVRHVGGSLVLMKISVDDNC